MDVLEEVAVSFAEAGERNGGGAAVSQLGRPGRRLRLNESRAKFLAVQLGVKTTTVAGLTMVSRVLGFIREMLVAAMLGTVAAYAIVTGPMHSEWVFLPVPLLATAGLAIILTLVIGFAGTWRALGAKPARYLRDE